MIISVLEVSYQGTPKIQTSQQKLDMGSLLRACLKDILYTIHSNQSFTTKFRFQNYHGNEFLKSPIITLLDVGQICLQSFGLICVQTDQSIMMVHPVLGIKNLAGMMACKPVLQAQKIHRMLVLHECVLSRLGVQLRILEPSNCCRGH